MKHLLIPSTFAFLLLIAIGCSGSSDSPVAPTTDQPDLTGTVQTTPSPDEPSSGHALMGYWNCVINQETGTVEFVPLRTSEFHFNMVGILEAGIMNITLVDPPQVIDGVLHVNICLQHPFETKPNLSGFDVKGILITEGTVTGFADPDIRIAGPNETRLINADGFSRWWNPAEFLITGMTGYIQGNLGHHIDPATTAILNGYKLFADGFDMNAEMSELDPGSRAFFEAGGSNSRHFEISLASGLHFNYAVDCSWAAPSPNPPVNLPDDFPPEANQSEPWFIEVAEVNNTLWFEDDDYGGNVNYDVVIHDWQGMGDIGELTFECPGIFSFTAAEPDSVSEFTGSYHFDVILPDLSSADPLDVLITIEVPGDYDSLLTGVSKPLRAYHRHLTYVSDEDPIYNLPPVAIMEATTPTDIFVDETVDFDASDSYDLDGYIIEYLWDFNGDGVYGDTYDGDPETPTHIFTSSGNFQVSVKVRDNSSGSSVSAPVSVLVTLDTNDPPVAVAEATSSTHILEGETISFDGTDSYDLDGEVVEWKWDFNGDGDFSDTFEGDMQTPTAAFPDPGTFFVDLKVIDNESGWGVLDDKIEVEVEDIPNVPPIAGAEATTPTEIGACGSVTFDASGSWDTDGTIDQYLWDFDGDDVYGDSYDSGTDINPTKSYYDEGVFYVQLKVIDDEGGEDTLDEPITITVTNVNPTAYAEATTPTEIYTAESVTFDASNSVDPDCDDIVSYEWDFDGDGLFGDPYDSGTDVNPTKTFQAPGEYHVSLIVTDGFGAEDELDSPIIITVNNHPPVACAEITSDWPYYWETDLEFSGTCSHDLEGPIVGWEWDLDANGSYEKTGEVVTYYFASDGDYLMQLRVTDDGGATDILDEPLEFTVYDDSNQPPIINEVTHSRTTSLKNSSAEAVELSVDFIDIGPPGDTHTFLWSCDYGSFDDETSPTPVWTPPNQIVKCDITVRVTDLVGMYDEGSCHQWVTQWSVHSNPNSPNGTDIIPVTLKDCFTDEMIAVMDYVGVPPNGNVIYINFWRIGCPHCTAELPDLTDMYNQYAGQDYIQLVINTSDSESTVENYLNSYDYLATHWLINGLSYFYLCNNWNGDSGGIPQHAMFDRDGNCRGAVLGGIHTVGYSYLTKYMDEWI